MTDAELLAEIDATPPARRGGRGAQIVNIPGVGEVEFPGSMSDAEITAASRKLHAGRPGPSEAEMMADLATADRAGDTELAQRIAARIKAARGPQTIPSHGQASGAPFDPDAYLAATDPASARPRPAPGKGESGVRGALQGASFGFGDEAAAAIDAALPSFLRNKVSDEAVGQGQTYGERYGHARDYYRGRNAAAQEANPGTYLGGEIVGSIAAPGGAAGGLTRAATQGAAMGLGYSDADLTRGQVGDALTDTATGTAFGVGGHGAGKLLKRSLAKLAQRGTQREATAAARAAQQGAEAATAPVNSLEAAARERAANAYRQMERVNLALADPALPAAERTALEAFKKSPEYAALLAANAKSIAAAAPEALAEREAARQVAAQARTALPAEIQQRTAELLTPQVGADAQSMFKRYGEPWAIGLGTYGAARGLGLDNTDAGAAGATMGLLSGRTRAGKALWDRINRPAHQAAIGRAEQKAAKGKLAKALVEVLRRGVPTAATDAATSDENAKAQAELDRLLSE